MNTINQQLQDGQREAGISSNGFFRFKSGENRMRILTEGSVIATHFFGKGQKATTCYGEQKGCPFHGEGAPKNKEGKEAKPSIKYTCYILTNGTIEMADLPYSAMKQIGDFQENIDYKFDSFPMPYDVTIKFDPDSKSPNDMYKVIASPKREPVSEAIMDELLEKVTKLSPADSVAKKKSWQMSEHEKDGTAQKRRDEFRQSVANTPKQEVDTIEYPKEEIDPDDIGF